MITRIEFKDETEKINIINNNKDKYLIEEMYLIEGNFLVFSDCANTDIILTQLDDKISILENRINELVLRMPTNTMND